MDVVGKVQWIVTRVDLFHVRGLVYDFAAYHRQHRHRFGQFRNWHREYVLRQHCDISKLTRTNTTMYFEYPYHPFAASAFCAASCSASCLERPSPRAARVPGDHDRYCKSFVVIRPRLIDQFIRRRDACFVLRHFLQPALCVLPEPLLDDFVGLMEELLADEIFCSDVSPDRDTMRR